MAADYIWEIRNPDGGMMGMEVAKALTAPADRVLAHAFPERIDMVVRDTGGALVARASGLHAEGSTPMSRLTLRDGGVERENIWPTETDHSLPVLLVGGEVGILLRWWNADDHTEWRWQLEFYNHT